MSGCRVPVGGRASPSSDLFGACAGAGRAGPGDQRPCETVHWLGSDVSAGELAAACQGSAALIIERAAGTACGCETAGRLVPRRQLCLTTRSAYRLPVAEAVASLASGAGPSPQDPTVIAAALQEAIANAVVHGNLQMPGLRATRPDLLEAFSTDLERRLAAPLFGQRPVTIGVDWNARSTTFWVEDQGAGFVPQVEVPPAGAVPVELAGGRGIWLMRRLADEVAFEAGGRRVRLRFDRPARATVAGGRRC